MTQHCDIGLIGLGVMGRNFLLNLADHGFRVVGYDLDGDKVAALRTEGKGKGVQGAEDLEGFVGFLRSPRAVMLLVPAGEPVDAVIRELVPRLSEGDLIVDGGNSFYRDTDRRAKALRDKGLHYLGVGVSGGEYGARHGPSMMPGGAKEAYLRVKPLFEKAAAAVDGEPCVAYLGSGSAGHYVKLVHNGIEYAVMELIAESYDLMRRGLGLSNDELHQVFDGWNRGELGGYLLEITAKIFLREDAESDRRLVDVILDSAKQKGTGKWTSQDAMDLGVPVPTVDAAVGARHLSALKEERVSAAERLSGPDLRRRGAGRDLVDHFHGALYVGTVLTYAQGFAQLAAASREYGYGLDLGTVARIWRGGCIIRSNLLERICEAYRSRPDLPNLLLDPLLGRGIQDRQDSLRTAARAAADFGIPAPGLMAALAYYDGYRTERLPANLIQAQRDFFGSHAYERVDRAGTFHTEWEGRDPQAPDLRG